MALEADFCLLGTGLAPLIAANTLMNQGKSVLVLNPDWDFFLENSELPLDPLLVGLPNAQSLKLNTPEEALEVLRPEFPGAIEFWTSRPEATPGDHRGYHDPDAPHLRQRSRLWISSPDKDRLWNWSQLEDLYVETADAGLNPQVLDGLRATRRFPGFGGNGDNFRGLYLPKLYDLDIVRYRSGVLEYIRERLNPEKRVICAINELDCANDGIRFRSKGESFAAKLHSGLLVFWTPRLTSWIINHAKKLEKKIHLPKGIRIWEQWLINSRDPLDTTTVGMFGDLAVWADFEGTSDKKIYQLSALRASPLVSGLNSPNLNWASAESFRALFSLFQDFLKWDRFSVRALHTRHILEWDRSDESTEYLSRPTQGPYIRLIPDCDGSVLNMIRKVRSVCKD